MWPLALMGGSTLAGSILGYMGYKSQASAMGDLSKQAKKYGSQARQDFREARRDIRARLAPWETAGVGSLEDLQRIQEQYEGAIQDPSRYIQSPGYAWLQEQGIGAIDRGAAARGKLDSGQNLKDLVRFNQGLASQDYGNYLGRLENLMNQYTRTSQMGQNAASEIAGYDFATRQGQANTYLQTLGQQGTASLGLANARTGLYNNLANISSNAANQYMLWNYLNSINSVNQQQPQQQQSPPLWGQSNPNALYS